MLIVRADGPFTDAPSWFVALFVFAGIMVVGGWIFRAVQAGQRFKVYRDAGLNPLTHQAEIEAKIAQAGFMTKPISIEQRLAELDDLCQRGVISDSERTAARAKILAEG